MKKQLTKQEKLKIALKIKKAKDALPTDKELADFAEISRETFDSRYEEVKA